VVGRRQKKGEKTYYGPKAKDVRKKASLEVRKSLKSEVERNNRAALSPESTNQKGGGGEGRDIFCSKSSGGRREQGFSKVNEIKRTGMRVGLVNTLLFEEVRGGRNQGR